MLTYNTRIITVYEDAIPRQDGFHDMVLDIKAAIAAAAEGRNHYGLTPDGNDYGEGRVGDDEGVGQCRGIPEKRLHSLQTDKVIQDEDLGFIVNNMYTLCKLGVPNAPLGIAAMDATIVELSLHCGYQHISGTKYHHRLRSTGSLDAGPCQYCRFCSEWAMGLSWAEAAVYRFPT